MLFSTPNKTNYFSGITNCKQQQQLYLPQQFNYNGEGYWPPKITKELRKLGGQFTEGKLHY